MKVLRFAKPMAAVLVCIVCMSIVACSVANGLFKARKTSLGQSELNEMKCLYTRFEKAAYDSVSDRASDWESFWATNFYCEVTKEVDGKRSFEIVFIPNPDKKAWIDNRDESKKSHIKAYALIIERDDIKCFVMSDAGICDCCDKERK